MPIHYDPLLSKLCAHGEDRAHAIARLQRAVAEYKIVGVRTTLPLFARVLRNPAFQAGDFDTSFLDQLPPEAPSESELLTAAIAAAVRAFRERQKGYAPAPAARGGSGWWQAGLREGHRGRA